MTGSIVSICRFAQHTHVICVVRFFHVFRTFEHDKQPDILGRLHGEHEEHFILPRHEHHGLLGFLIFGIFHDGMVRFSSMKSVSVSCLSSPSSTTEHKFSMRGYLYFLPITEVSVLLRLHFLRGLFIHVTKHPKHILHLSLCARLFRGVPEKNLRMNEFQGKSKK